MKYICPVKAAGKCDAIGSECDHAVSHKENRHCHLNVTGKCKACVLLAPGKTLRSHRAQTTNNARDEIAALANELEDFNSNRVAPYGRITEIVAKMRQLSPIA